MTTTEQTATLLADARRVACLPDELRARRWLRAACSLLADWGGASVREALAQAIPSALRRGSGRSLAAALATAGTQGASVVAHLEAARRAGEPDPAKAGVALRPLLGLIRERLHAAGGAAGVAAVQAALPPSLREAFAAGETSQPWSYRLIPQSYARPQR